MRTSRWLALVALMWLPVPVCAQTPSQWQRPILPDRATYYEPGRGGMGLTVDVGPDGYIFATLYTYDDDGDPTFYAMQGYFQPAYDIAQTRSIGTFDAPLYVSRHGECVGAGCSYRSPERILTDLEAHIVWTTSRRATMTIGNQTWNLQAAQLTVPDTDRIAGTWTATITDREMANGDIGSRIAMLRIVPIEPSRNPVYTKTYDVTCASTAGATGPLATTCPDLFAYLTDGATGVDGFGILYYFTGYGGMMLGPYVLGDDGQPYFLGPNNGLRYELQLSLGVIRGRTMITSDTGRYETDRGTIDMLRVPDGTYEVSSAPSAE